MSALISLELLSQDSPGPVNAVRPLLHTLATNDPNAAVRRLAILCLRNGSPQRDTIVLLAGLGDNEEEEPNVRATATRVAGILRKRAATR